MAQIHDKKGLVQIMKRKELLKLVWTNLMQNKFKIILTSIGIIVGAATIVMVIAIGQGGQEEVLEQFKNLNAGAIDISYEMVNSGTGNINSIQGNQGGMPAGMPKEQRGKNASSGNHNFPANGGGIPGGNENDFFMKKDSFGKDDRMNQEKITLSEDDMEEIKSFVPGISSVSISYTAKSTVNGGDLEEETSYTIAGVKSIYQSLSNLVMSVGSFVTEENEENKDKVCILGANVASEIFGSAMDAYDNTIYIDNRPYIVNGVVEAMGTVSSGISPDDAIFIPYSTGEKYITGTNLSPTITVIAKDLNHIDEVISNIKTVLAETYPNAEFTIADAGSKMEAASASNDTLTMLLFAMAAIVFVVGGIGIMNVLFVSVKERTKEIGILKAIGCAKRDILIEFVLEASCISLLGGVLGVILSMGLMPIAEMLNIRIVFSFTGVILAIIFAILTGTIFGFYPAWKASNLVPVEALKED